MVQFIKEWVMACEQRIKKLRTDCKLTCQPLQNPKEYITSPEDAMQFGLVPELPLSGGYENFPLLICIRYI